jgi:cellulose synthase/poly-beta-1,6-N-acetylglucosamine synthase-like glycosyltransferase
MEPHVDPRLYRELQAELAELKRVTVLVTGILETHALLDTSLAETDMCSELTTLAYVYKNYILTPRTRTLAQTLQPNLGMLKHPPDLGLLMASHQRKEKIERRYFAIHMLRTHLQTVFDVDTLAALKLSKDLLKDC